MSLPRIVSIGNLAPVCDLPVPPEAKKKADVGEHFETLPHVGLLFNEPPGRAELLFM
jgi:hypothetical protein